MGVIGEDKRLRRVEFDVAGELVAGGSDAAGCRRDGGWETIFFCLIEDEADGGLDDGGGRDGEDKSEDAGDRFSCEDSEDDDDGMEIRGGADDFRCKEVCIQEMDEEDPAEDEDGGKRPLDESEQDGRYGANDGTEDGNDAEESGDESEQHGEFDAEDPESESGERTVNAADDELSADDAAQSAC